MNEDFEIDTEFEEDKGCENTLPCSECVHYASCSWWQYLTDSIIGISVMSCGMA